MLNDFFPLQLSHDAVTSFFWCYGERSGNEIRGWASRSMNQIVKTILFKRDGVE